MHEQRKGNTFLVFHLIASIVDQLRTVARQLLAGTDRLLLKKLWQFDKI